MAIGITPVPVDELPGRGRMEWWSVIKQKGLDPDFHQDEALC
jgi:hypothetical protein